MAWTDLTENTVAFASEVNGNFQEIAIGTLFPLADSATMAATGGVFSIGTDTAYWKAVYINNLVATNQTINLSGGSLNITGTLTIDIIEMSAASTIYVGTWLWGGTSTTMVSGNHVTGFIDDGTKLHRKRFDTSLSVQIGTLTVSHGITSGMARILRIMGGAYISNPAGDLSGNRFFAAPLTVLEDDIPPDTQTIFHSFSWDDDDFYVNSVLFPTIANSNYRIEFIVEYTAE